MYFALVLGLFGAGTLTGASSDLSPPNPACPSRNVPLEGRKSPLDSLSFTLDGKQVKLCYGRPAARGRTMLGREIPYGKLWRTGANEPTIFFAPAPLTVAGIKVPAGVYSLYTEPGASEWVVIVNRSISQWGHENSYTTEVKAQEVGRAKVKSEVLKTPVEAFTIKAEPAGAKASLLLEWEKTRVRIPVEAAK